MLPENQTDPVARIPERGEHGQLLSFLPSAHPFAQAVARFRAALAVDPEFTRLAAARDAAGPPGLRLRFSGRRRNGAWILRHLYLSVQRLSATGAGGPLARTFQWDAGAGAVRSYGWEEDDRLPGARYYLSDNGAGLEAEEGTLALLRYIPGQRLTFRFRRRGGPALIGKLVAKGRAAPAYARLRDVHAAVHGAGAPFAAARPAEFDGVGEAFFQELLPGSPLPGLVTPQNLEHWMARVGALHAAIHDLRVPSAPAGDLDAWRQNLEERCEWAALALPQHAALLGEARRILFLRPPLPGPRDLGFCHSAFGCGQLLAAGERLSVVDFDEAEVSDRALEIARFLVLLKKHLPLLAGAAGRGLLERARAAYLDGYRGAGGALPDGQRLWWYRTAWEIDHLARCVTADDLPSGSAQASAAALEQALGMLGAGAPAGAGG